MEGCNKNFSTCKYCGKEGLKWFYLIGKWCLVDPETDIDHDCVRGAMPYRHQTAGINSDEEIVEIHNLDQILEDYGL